MKNVNHLFVNIKDCSGCSACLNACPKNAIHMEKDEFNNLFPHINTNLCVDCGLCDKVCNFKYHLNDNIPLKAYASISKDKELLSRSASGGVFASIATTFLESGGVVYGSSMIHTNESLRTQHIRIDDKSDLWKIQGSKYVQSNLNDIYKQIRKDLFENKKVLFTGTPCQVDGLYGFLNNIKYENLFTMDLICHGVPSEKLLLDYIEIMEKRLHGTIIQINFRDKSAGWGLNGTITYKDKIGNIRKKKMPLQGFSYYKLFLESSMYRENCYTCKYASLNRVGDLTIGDYWGIEKEHPDYLEENGGELDIKNGVSCILANTEKGNALLEKYGELLVIKESNVMSVKKINHQLQRPSNKSKYRDELLNVYKSQGYGGLEKHYYNRFGWKKYLYKIWNYLPGQIIK